MQRSCTVTKKGLKKGLIYVSDYNPYFYIHTYKLKILFVVVMSPLAIGVGALQLNYRINKFFLNLWKEFLLFP